MGKITNFFNWFPLCQLKQNLSDRFYCSLSDEEYQDDVEKYFVDTELPDKNGNGVDISYSKKAIKQAFIAIERKSHATELSDGERWLFENNYFFNSHLSKKSFNNFFRLPHTGKEPRIVAIARRILLNSGFELDDERIKVAIKAQNSVHSLTYLEICHLPDAFSFVLLEKIAILSQKSLLIEKLRRLAMSNKSSAKSFLASSLFRYLLGKEKGFDTSSKLKFLMNTVAVDFTRSVNACVTSLHRASELNFVSSYKPLEFLDLDLDFKDMSSATRNAYLEQISKESDSLNKNEVLYAKKIMELSKQMSVHFGELLFDQPQLVKDYLVKGTVGKPSKIKAEKVAEVCYITSFFLLLVALSVGIGLYLALAFLDVVSSVFVVLLSFFALMPVCFDFLNRTVKLFVKPRPVFKMNYEVLPDSAQTLVVVSEFIATESEIEGIVRKFNTTKALNEDKNITFALLIDTKPSETETSENDIKICEGLKAYKDLKFFVRRKVLINGKYCARERKRGAIEVLCKALSLNNFSEFSFVSFTPQKPEYIVVLDDDSVLEPHSVRESVCAMLHPLNRNFDLLAFQCRINLNSISSNYSMRFASSGGREVYCGYSDLHFNLMGKALFCGKGIFKLDSFMQKVHGKLPDNRILSHDVLEGAIMKSGSLSEFVFEDAPDSFKSDLSRKMRWERGDTQNLPFVFSKKLKISCFYKMIMLINGLSPLSIVALVALFLWSAIALSPPIAIWAGIIFLFPFAINALSALFSIYKQKTGYVFLNLFRTVANAITEAVLLIPRAVIAFYGFLTAIYRMITNKKLLEWKTFSQGQSTNNLAQIQVDEKTEKILTLYARDLYRYFEENTVDGLVADHYQAFLDKGQSDYTSSTNIGFSLLAHISACELGFIDKDEAKARVLCTLEAVSALKLWNGHLYNWYSLQTREPLSPFFVSSVDSGNFIASLFVLKGYFRDDIDLCEKLENIISKTRFDLLYDKKREQFFIGYNELSGKFEGHYDLLASEARILTIVAIALGIPIRSWNSLSRRHTAGFFNTLYSWSGTGFEYLLADLFLEAPYGSMLLQSSKNAVIAQIRTRCQRFWGISECAYFSLDEKNNFRYKAFGISSISMRAEHERCVISPYTNFLALKYNQEKALSNLARIKDYTSYYDIESQGTYGDYGFAEAIDFSKNKAGNTVSTFMAHHQGMSLVAIANHLKDNLASNHFYNDERTFATKILLTEPIITVRGEAKQKTKRLDVAPSGEIHFAHIDKPMMFPAMNFGGIKYCVAIDDFGQGYSVCNGVLVNRFRSRLFRSYGAFLFAVENGKEFSPTYAPLKQTQKFSADFFTNRSEFTNHSNGITQEVLTSPLFLGELRHFKLTPKQNNNGRVVNKQTGIKSKIHRELDIVFYTDLCLNTFDADASHQSFSNLMIETSFDEKRNVIYATRKPRENERGMYCALLVKGLKNITPVTSKFDVVGRNREVDNPIILENLKNNKIITRSLGDVLEPCLAFSAKLVSDGDFSFDCAIVYAESQRELEEQVHYAMSPSFYDFMLKTGKSAENTMGEDMERFARALLPKLIYSPYPQKVAKKLERLKTELDKGILGLELTQRVNEERNALALATEFKILYYKFNGNLSRLKALGELMNSLSALDIKTMLVIAYDEEDTYYENIRKSVTSLLSNGRFKLVRYFHELWREVSFFEIDDNLSIEVNEQYFVAENCPRQIESQAQIMQSQITENDDFVLSSSCTPEVPFSNVMCREKGGTIITENGGGFTYFENSRENKLTEFYQDAVSNTASEQLFAVGKDWFARLNANCDTTYSVGKIKQHFSSENLIATVEQYLILNGGAKVVEVTIEKLKQPFNLVLSLDLALGEKGKNYVFSTQKFRDTTVFRNLNTNSKFIVRAIGGQVFENGSKVHSRLKCQPFAVLSLVDVMGAVADIPIMETGTYKFIIGADDYILLLDKQTLEQEKKAELEFWNTLNKVEIKTNCQTLDTMFNRWIPYQIVSSRFFGRCGYYQTGGAIGFRDQLQDSLAVMKMNQSLAREMILTCAKHQYVEGDVMHWWHYERHGVRTRISDDKMFLPYVVCEYIKWTGDNGILNEKLPYLVSKPLEDGGNLDDNGQIIPRENDRYEVPEVTNETYPLIEHMEKAVQSALKFGENNLLLIAGGDWNDALNDVGNDTMGESVWLSMFACIVLEQMSEHYSGNSKISLLDMREKLATAIEETYSGDRYKRLITKEGEWLGEKGAVMEIDLISQSFASLSNVCDKSRVNIALDTAWRELVDEEHGIVKLLTPAFENGYGYISSYPKGVRENGGQYTHASVWYALALLNENRIDEAYEILQMLNPLEKCKSEVLRAEYKGEPFVLAGDIYTNDQHYGRMGWSWYTGSAGWYYTAVLKMLGIELRGKSLILSPKIPKELDGAQITLKAYDTTANITIRHKGEKALFLGGTKMSNLSSVELGKSEILTIEVWC